eukprot:CAMPEP_0175066052 /NCGR_PEP_ID=MMETSP0052_2-20121109/16286_1 /TAXON_ID=51329 ORGANISM="Polytomella parva, Strain SAG 63-3" /NCGR_SAMPLE_ID=MMETSP0052_2 /ASSEMBLY_ACC=CAM_ASM_000194 /LENGTH=246 /DNA_ID=CAMNT_0016332695 /DNA_START=99 /DNA_END=837 /DNA_ORIENTATION=+
MYEVEESLGLVGTVIVRNLDKTFMDLTTPYDLFRLLDLFDTLLVSSLDLKAQNSPQGKLVGVDPKSPLGVVLRRLKVSFQLLPFADIESLLHLLQSDVTTTVQLREILLVSSPPSSCPSSSPSTSDQSSLRRWFQWRREEEAKSLLDPEGAAVFAQSLRCPCADKDGVQGMYDSTHVLFMGAAAAAAAAMGDSDGNGDSDSDGDGVVDEKREKKEADPSRCLKPKEMCLSQDDIDVVSRLDLDKFA